MKGKIIIEGHGDQMFSIEMRMENVTQFQKILILDNLAKVLQLTKEERMMVAITSGEGGVEAICGHGPTTISMDTDTYDKLRKGKE